MNHSGACTYRPEEVVFVPGEGACESINGHETRVLSDQQGDRPRALRILARRVQAVPGYVGGDDYTSLVFVVQGRPVAQVL